MKILTYNVNGIRAALKKGWLEWLKGENPDVICIQEIKATPDQVPEIALLEEMGYEHYWYPAQKKGYSGTAIFTRITPNHIEYGCGHEDYDFEGRIIRADFDKASVMSVYFPSGTTGDVRQDFKYKFLDDFQSYSNDLLKEKPNLVVCGDFNIFTEQLISIIQNPMRIALAFYPLKENGWKTLLILVTSIHLDI